MDLVKYSYFVELHIPNMIFIILDIMDIQMQL